MVSNMNIRTEESLLAYYSKQVEHYDLVSEIKPRPLGQCGPGKPPTPGHAGLELLECHFNLPRERFPEIVDYYCTFGQVYFDHDRQAFLLGLSFSDGSQKLYPNELFASSLEVKLSVWKYWSVERASDPRSEFFDVRFKEGILPNLGSKPKKRTAKAARKP